MLGDIDIEFALQIDPQFGTITEQLSKSQRHRWRDRLFSVGMSCSVCREMPSIAAISVFDFPSAGNTSSRKMAPGSLGGVPFNRIFARPSKYNSVIAAQHDE